MRGARRDATGSRPNLREIGQRAARRVRAYSRLVAWMKVILPLAALALIAAIFVTTRDRGDLSEIFTPEELATLGAGLRLEHPRFAGVTDRGEPFAIRAEWALPDRALPRYVDLEKPEGEIEMKDSRTVSAQAATGRLHREEKTLVLNGGVVLDSSDGYHFETEQMIFDLDAETAEAPGPVKGSGPRGTIEAGGFRAMTGRSGSGDASAGREIWFENRVRVVFIPAMTPAGN